MPKSTCKPCRWNRNWTMVLRAGTEQHLAQWDPDLMGMSVLFWLGAWVKSILMSSNNSSHSLTILFNRYLWGAGRGILWFKRQIDASKEYQFVLEYRSSVASDCSVHLHMLCHHPFSVFLRHVLCVLNVWIYMHLRCLKIRGQFSNQLA